MTVDPDLLALLACPSDDHARLTIATSNGVETLVCTCCATSYPIEDGIPVLLREDATPGPNGIGIPAQ